jgi:hypothetical protein
MTVAFLPPAAATEALTHAHLCEDLSPARRAGKCDGHRPPLHAK